MGFCALVVYIDENTVYVLYKWMKKYLFRFLTSLTLYHKLKAVKASKQLYMPKQTKERRIGNGGK